MTKKVDHPEPTPISQKRKELTKEMTKKVDHPEPTPISKRRNDEKSGSLGTDPNFRNFLSDKKTAATGL